MDEIRDLERRLAEWRDAGLITAEQATMILEREERPEAPRARSSALSEILGYLGGSLALVAAIVLVSRFWYDIAVAARLSIVGGTTVLVGVAGALLVRRGSPAILRLSDFLFVLATIGLASFVALFCGEVLEVTDRARAVWTAGSAAVASAGFWWLRRSPIRHAALFVSLVATTTASLALLDGLDAQYFGFALWALGIAWGLLALADVVPPREVGFGLAAAAVVIGSQMLGAGEGEAAGLILALATVAALVGAGVFLDSALVLGIGTLGVFMTVPRAMFTWFGEAAGGAVALLITGLVLLAAAVGINKIGRRVIRSARAEARAERRRRLPASRRSLLVASAVVVLLLGFGYVLFIGYTAPPDYDPIPADVAIPGTIAFLRWEGDENCLFTIPAAGGGERRVACGEGFGGPVLWTPDGHLVIVTWDGEPQVLVVDAATGAVIATDARFDTAERRIYETADTRMRRADGATLVSNTQEGRVDDGAATIEVRRAGFPDATVLSVAGPRSYGFWDLQWSPDGHWVLAGDSASRTIVVSADGAVGPFVLLEDASSPAWFIPGNGTYTFTMSG